MYLDDSRTRTCSDDSGRRANVESVVAVSPRPDDIDHEIFIAVINGRRDRSGPQQARGGCQRLRSPLETRYVKRSEECADLGRVNRARGENVFEGELEVVGAEILWCFDELV